MWQSAWRSKSKNGSIPVPEARTLGKSIGIVFFKVWSCSGFAFFGSCSVNVCFGSGSDIVCFEDCSDDIVKYLYGYTKRKCMKTFQNPNDSKQLLFFWLNCNPKQLGILESTYIMIQGYLIQSDRL